MNNITDAFILPSNHTFPLQWYYLTNINRLLCEWVLLNGYFSTTTYKNNAIYINRYYTPFIDIYSDYLKWKLTKC